MLWCTVGAVHAVERRHSLVERRCTRTRHLGRVAGSLNLVAGMRALGVRVVGTGPATERRANKHLRPRYVQDGGGKQHGGADAAAEGTHVNILVTWFPFGNNARGIARAHSGCRTTRP